MPGTYILTMLTRVKPLNVVQKERMSIIHEYTTPGMPKQNGTINHIMLCIITEYKLY